MRKNAINIIRQFIKNEKWDNYLVILPTQYLVEEFIDLLLDHEISGVLYPQFYTFETFVAKILKEKHDVTYISDITRVTILTELIDQLIINGEIQYFKHPVSYGIIQYISEAIDELKENLISPDLFTRAVKSQSNVRLHDLALIYASYNEKLLKNNLKDKQDRFIDVLTILENDNSILSDIKYVYIDWFIDNTLVQEKIFNTILQRVDKSDAFLGTYGQDSIDTIRSKISLDGHMAKYIFTDQKPRTLAPEIGVFNKDGKEDEVKSVLHEVIRLLDNGASFDDMAIVARNPEVYTERLVEMFNQIGVPIDRQIKKTLISNQLIKSIFLWLDYASQAHEPWALDTLLSNYYLIEHFPEKEEVLAWSHTQEKHNIHEWQQLWEENGLGLSADSNKIIAEALNNLQDLANLSATKQSVSEIIWTIGRSISNLDLESRVKNFTQDIDLSTRLLLYYRDNKALEAFFDILTNLELAWSGSEKQVNLASVIANLRIHTENMNYAANKSNQGGIKLLSPTEIRGMEFKVVFLLGMEENVFPKRIIQNPIFKDADRHNLKSSFRLPFTSDVYEREKLLFYLVLLASREELFLIYSGRDENGETNLPSLFIDDVLSILPEGEMLNQHIPILKPLENTAHLEHLLIVEDMRNSNYFSIYEACFNEGVMREKLASKVAEQIFSISRLNLYAKCPLKYFFIIEMGLDDGIVGIDRLSFLDLGSLKHEALARIMQNIESYDLDNLLIITQGVLEDICQEKGWKGQEYPHTWLWELEKAEIAASLTELIQLEYARGDFKPSHFEWTFGFDEPFILKNGDDEIRLRGVIDRIDTDGQGNYAIYDYKESANMTRSEIINSIELQLPVYIMAVENFIGKVVGTAYIEIKSGKLQHFFFHKDSKEQLGFNMSRTRGLDPEEWQEWLDNVKLNISRYGKNIEEGIFPPIPYSCNYCHLLDICLYKPARLRQKLNSGGGLV